MKSIRLSGLSALIAGALLALPAAAQINLNMSIGTAPPPPRYEAVPPPRHGYTWAPGYWGWENDRHVWREGRYIETRHNERWVPDHWVRHERGYVHVPGHWER